MLSLQEDRRETRPELKDAVSEESLTGLVLSLWDSFTTNILF